jgi:transcriptional regulator with XRE-family HTH domain
MREPMIGSIIKELRKKKGLTQEELAKAVGVSRLTVSMWESGKASPKAEFLKKLAEVLEVNVNDLLGLEDKLTTGALMGDLFSVKEIADKFLKEVLGQKRVESLSPEIRITLMSWVMPKLLSLSAEVETLLTLLSQTPDNTLEFHSEGEELTKP